MTQITEDEYDSEVSTQAAYLVEAVTEDEVLNPQEELYEAVGDVLDHHNWFARSYHGPADHGAIIEYSNADPTMHGDWQAMAEADDPETMIKRVAYSCFEADVIESAQSAMPEW